MTYLAVSIYGKDISEFQSRISSAAQAGAEMLELRTDYLAVLDKPSVTKMIAVAKSASLPVLVTCRDEREGGVGHWQQDKRTEILLAAVDAGADYIDCEYVNFNGAVRKLLLQSLSRNSRTKLILSAHNFNGMFEDIGLLYDSILAACPDAIPKIVYTAKHINDCFAAFNILHENQGKGIIFAMGTSGMISRVLAKKLGAFLTFASLDEQQATAPGQLTVETMKKIYQWDSLNAESGIFGVIGDPVGHSLSPYIYNACFTGDRINAVHLPFWVQDDKVGFDLFMDHVLSRPWMHFGGFSVTLPHKTHALDYARARGKMVEPLAGTIGAVNTLKIGYNGLLAAYNTDYTGAMDALTRTLGIDRHQLHQKKAAVIGAGGVSRAVVAGLVNAGADVTIYNRTLEKARGMAEEFRCHYAGQDEVVGIEADIVVNCTSIGMTPNVNASPVPANIFKPGMTAFDTVYTPIMTQFLQDAQAAGATIVNGAEMFIRQAMAQYHIFTGRQPDESTMREIVFSKLGTAQK